MDLNYEPKCEVILASVASAPVLTAETALIDVHQSNQGTASAAYEQLKKARGNSQASLRFTVGNMGSLTEIDFRIYYYTNLGGTDVAFQRTSANVVSGVDTTSLYNLKVTAIGNYDIDFPLMACDGIKVTAQGVGTNTNSTVTNVHLALRTN